MNILMSGYKETSSQVPVEYHIEIIKVYKAISDSLENNELNCVIIFLSIILNNLHVVLHY